mgnify:CR=1 FL=1
MRSEWKEFKGGRWETEIDVRDFIMNNYTPYDGDDSFLQPELECDTGSRGRADLFIRNRRSGRRQYLLELKYLSEAKGTESAVASKLGEAKEQLARYRDAPNFKDVKNLDCWAIVFVNKEPKAVEKLA